MKPVIALVGRPNVGKSALFNRLIGENRSIVEDQPGVTRDRIYAECDWNGRDFLLVDTGGIIPDTAEGRTLEAVRDRALLLIGFAAALRRSVPSASRRRRCSRLAALPSRSATTVGMRSTSKSTAKQRGPCRSCIPTRRSMTSLAAASHAASSAGSISRPRAAARLNAARASGMRCDFPPSATPK